MFVVYLTFFSWKESFLFSLLKAGYFVSLTCINEVLFHLSSTAVVADVLVANIS